MNINSLTYPMQQPLSEDKAQVRGRYSYSTSNVAKTLNMLAIPALALFVFANMPGAEALPPCYVACVAVCTGGGTAVVFPPAVLACLSGCIPLMFCPIC